MGADPKEIIFTSGATESNNMAIKGVANFYQDKKRHIITTQTERAFRSLHRFWANASCICHNSECWKPVTPCVVHQQVDLGCPCIRACVCAPDWQVRGFGLVSASESAARHLAGCSPALTRGACARPQTSACWTAAATCSSAAGTSPTCRCRAMAWSTCARWRPPCAPTPPSSPSCSQQ